VNDAPVEVLPDAGSEPAGGTYTSRSIAGGILAVIAVIAALYLGRAFFIPLLIGILASYMLHPMVDWLKAHHLPRGIGAALVLGTLVGLLSWITFALSDDANTMIGKFPEAARELREKLSVSRNAAPTALQNMQEAASQIEGAATDAGAKPGARSRPAALSAPTAWLSDYALAQTALLATVVAQTPIVLLLTYFLLASGGHFRRKLVGFVGPSLSRKKDAVRILAEIDTQVQYYLLAVLGSNIAVGVGTWLAFQFLGLEHAAVWGVAAGILHFVPYLGPLLLALTSGVASFLQSGSVLYAIEVAGASMVVAGVVGVGFMTWLQSRFASINAAVLFIALLFFGWLWGMWGLLLGAPLVAIAKVICDRVDPLKPIGELMGH
jgi:predicted PurR-regulated permease PerM